MDKDDSPAPRMQVGIMPDVGGGPVPRFDHVAAQVRAAEQVGFDSFWLSDHLLFRFPPRETGRWEVMTMLGALAAITHRIRLGPLVACTAFRPPALLAKIADTLDEVSAGRLILGLGAGWHEPEFRAFGYPFDHRVSRFAEALEIVVPLLRKGQVDFVGEYVEAHDAQLVPRGPSRSGPPIWIAGKGPRMLRLAARYADAWNTAWHSDPSEVVRAQEDLRQICAEVGRDPDTLDVTVGTFARVVGPGEQRMANEPGLVGTAEEVAAALQGFADIGVKHLIVSFVHEEPDNAQHIVPTIERFGDVLSMLQRR